MSLCMAYLNGDLLHTNVYLIKNRSGFYEEVAFMLTCGFVNIL